MSKFKVVKKLSLDFLGEGWKDAYINFQVLTIADIKNKFPALMKLKADDAEAVINSMGMIVEVLEDKFVDGKGFDGTKLIDFKKEDIENLPNELLKRALDFLSQGVTTPSSPQ